MERTRTARWEGIRLPRHISISGVRHLEAASTAADCMRGMHQQWRGEDGLASGLQTSPPAMLRANLERAEVGQVASPSPSLALGQAGVRSTGCPKSRHEWRRSGGAQKPGAQGTLEASKGFFPIYLHLGYQPERWQLPSTPVVSAAGVRPVHLEFHGIIS